eukprot:15447820-Alexandrium_andersonii.AAC.1
MSHAEARRDCTTGPGETTGGSPTPQLPDLARTPDRGCGKPRARRAGPPTCRSPSAGTVWNSKD